MVGGNARKDGFYMSNSVLYAMHTHHKPTQGPGFHLLKFQQSSQIFQLPLLLSLVLTDEEPTGNILYIIDLIQEGKVMLLTEFNTTFVV